MAFRFWRRVKIAPGLTLNLSKSGASLSAGRTVAECLPEQGNDLDVTFCCFSECDLAVYEKVLAEAVSGEQ